MQLVGMVIGDAKPHYPSRAGQRDADYHVVEGRSFFTALSGIRGIG